MSGNDAEGLPAKKRRRVMEQPDGFQKPKPVDTVKTKIQAPKFASAFDGAVDDAHTKLMRNHKLDLRPDFASKPVSKASLSKPVSKTNLKQLAAPSFLLPAKETEKKSAPALRVLPPPDPWAAAKGESSSTTSTVPVLQLRPPPPPPPPHNAPSSKLPSKPVAPLNTLQAPNIFAPAEVILDPSLRTISTTEIALATDLSTDSGAAELAHIFLHDQHPEIAASNREEHMEWNIGMSPQKGAKFVKGKGKEAKYVKGGLAARALYEDAFQWYTSFDELGELIERPNPTPALELLTKVVKHLVDTCRWALHRIHLFGFAQGGSVAAEFGVRWTKENLAAQRGTDTVASANTGTLGSIISISGPLLSYPTLSSKSSTPVLVVHNLPPAETSLPPGAIVAFKKAFESVIEKTTREPGMPSSRGGWEPIMQFWSSHLGRRQISGLYEVLSGSVPTP
ncbi:hypothetical protein DXG03_004230 [Asterophora parasitica]|uniref:Phospholipase/carboxylesterase/thioesterase domain-containing protein n=1 Tax=Asterophora parasitica TaxID=117018 RepID=A0A9P7GFF8_9AGAR|nr:hypothetical protein DXG03_004230 [Asterophora parasitica]